MVELRSLTANDAKAFVAPFEEDPELWIRIGLGAPPTVESFLAGLPEEADWRRWGIFAEGAFLGSVVLLGIDHRNRRAEVGIWLAPAARGRGAGVDALEQVARIAFGELGLERLWLQTEADNAPMRALAARSGFTEEGLLRAHDRNPDGARADIVIAGRLR